MVPVAALGTLAPVAVFGPWIDTFPPTSTIVLAPVIAPVSRMQRSPFVLTFVTKVIVSMVRQVDALSW